MENYFDLFEIPIHLNVDTQALRPKFFALSRASHPDFFVTKSDEQQQAALEKTALLNKAWKIFQQPDETLRYVLEIHQAWVPGEKYELSPDFLMEVMELNEAMMESDEPEQLRNRVDTLRSELETPVSSYLSENPFIPTPEKLSILKEFYYRKKYLERMMEQLPK
jgi:molecular chaperone HscB